MAYRVKGPDITVTNDDTFGFMLTRALGTKLVPFRREYHPDGAPAPRVDLTSGDITDYDGFSGRKVLTSYRRSQLPDRDAVARHLTNYPRIVANLTDPELFDVEQVDALYSYWINGRGDHNPRYDHDPAVKRRDAGRGMEFKFDARMFKAAGANRVLTFHPHFHREPGVINVEGLEVVCLDAVPSMVRYAQEELGIDGDCMVLNPDMKPAKKGKYDIAFEFASVADLDSDHLMANRTGEESKETIGEVDAQGRQVLIADDMLSTLGTVRSAIPLIKNPAGIYVMAVHAVLPRVGHSSTYSLISSEEYPVRDIVAAQTINSDFSKVPVHDVVGDFYDGRLDYIEELSDDFGGEV